MGDEPRPIPPPPPAWPWWCWCFWKDDGELLVLRLPVDKPSRLLGGCRKKRASSRVFFRSDRFSRTSSPPPPPPPLPLMMLPLR